MSSRCFRMPYCRENFPEKNRGGKLNKSGRCPRRRDHWLRAISSLLAQGAHIATASPNVAHGMSQLVAESPLRGPSRDWGCDGGRVFPHSFSDRGWIRGLGFEAGGNRGGRRGVVRGRRGD